MEVSDPASLEELKKKRPDNQKLLTSFYPDFWPHQFDNMLMDTQQLSVPSSYSIEQSKETAINIPFDIELGLGIKLGLGLQLTGKESISADMESGVIKQSVHRATTTYEEDPELLNHKQSLASFVKTITKPVDREWKIRFNQPVDMSIFTGGEIAVFEANQDQVPIIIVPSENDYVLTIISTEKYQYGQCLLALY